MKNITKFWFLKDFNLFKKMGKKNLMEMCNLLEMVNVKRGETLQFNREEKNLVYFIKSGTIKIVSKDKEYTRSILSTGNIFGELAIYRDEMDSLHTEKAVVLENGVVCVITADQMKMMMEKYSSLKNQLLKLQGLKIRKLKCKLENLLYKDSEMRIKEYIISYIKDFGKQKGKMMQAKNSLTHQDIAYLTNTSRQTVSNVMSKLRKEGVIDYNSNEIYYLG